MIRTVKCSKRNSEKGSMDVKEQEKERDYNVSGQAGQRDYSMLGLDGQKWEGTVLLTGEADIFISQAFIQQPEGRNRLA